MNGTKHNFASIETLPQFIATGPALLGCFSAGGKLERPDANKLGTKAKDIGQSLLAVLVKAFHCRRAPGRDGATGCGTRQPWSGVMPSNCLLPTRELSSTAGDSGRASCICRGDWPDPSALFHI
jgi:hypothetical protein